VRPAVCALFVVALCSACGGSDEEPARERRDGGSMEAGFDVVEAD